MSKIIVFGNICFPALKLADSVVPVDIGVNGQFRIEVCNSNKTGVPTDGYWGEVIPSWKNLVAPYKDGHMTEAEYREKYMADLASKHTFIVMSFQALVKEAKDKLFMALCHEVNGFCHRYVLRDYLFQAGLINAILNNGHIICARCYEEWSDDELWSESPDHSIEGWTTKHKCSECEGEEVRETPDKLPFDDIPF
jgi:hypothetical protein